MSETIGGVKAGFNDVYGIDRETQALQSVDLAHSMAHQGKRFLAQFVDLDADTSDTLVLKIISPAAATGKVVHAVFGVSTSGPGLLELLEGPTVTVAGTAVTPVNRNRGSATTAASTVTHTPTITADGTALATDAIGSGGAPLAQAGGSTDGDRAEWLLNAATTYAFRYTAKGDNQIVSLYIDFYETQDLA